MSSKKGGGVGHEMWSFVPRKVVALWPLGRRGEEGGEGKREERGRGRRGEEGEVCTNVG